MTTANGILDGSALADILAATPADRAAVQSALLPDTRILAPIYKGGIDGTRVFVCGDSRIEQLAGIGFVPYVGGLPDSVTNLCPELAGKDVKFHNRGGNGQTFDNFLDPSSTTANTGGVLCTKAGLLAAIAGVAKPVVAMLYGANDYRTLAALAGSAYGDTAQQTRAALDRAKYAALVQDAYAVNPNVRFIFMMGAAHATTPLTFFTNGVIPQNVMDMYRLTHRGDVALGISALDDYVNAAVGKPVSLMLDTLRLVDSDRAEAFRSTVNADALHQTFTGQLRLMRALTRLFRGARSESLTSVASATRAQWQERVWARGGHRPLNVEMLELSGEYDIVGTAFVSGSTGTYLDVRPGVSTADGDAAWGAGAGAGYGTVNRPGLLRGDVIVFTKTSDGSKVIVPVTNLPGANQGSGVLRWSAGPDGVFYNGILVTGDTGVIYRHRHGCAPNADWNDQVKGRGAITALAAYPNAYRVYIKSASGSAITVQEVRGYGPSGHTITTSDVLAMSGGDDTLVGLPLTGASIAAGANPGETVITLASNNWVRLINAQAVILSTT